jgi:hypothetical protein
LYGFHRYFICTSSINIGTVNSRLLNTSKVLVFRSEDNIWIRGNCQTIANTRYMVVTNIIRLAKKKTPIAET